jgi:hypothetical protein
LFFEEIYEKNHYFTIIRRFPAAETGSLTFFLARKANRVLE